MCAAYGLIETHLGLKDPEAAKAQAAERFIALHFKLLSYQVPLEGQQEAQPEGVAGPLNSFHNNPSVSFLREVLVDVNSLGVGMLTRHLAHGYIPGQYTGGDDTVRTYIASSRRPATLCTLDSADGGSQPAVNSES